MISRQQKYKVYTQNARSIEAAIGHIYLNLKRAIRLQKLEEVNSLFKVMLSQVAILAEVELLKILQEPNGFSDADIARVIGAGPQLEMWKQTVKIAFSTRFSVPIDNLEPPNISFDNYSRLGEILRILEADFEPFILLRNKISHGQWARCLNFEHTDYDNRAMQIINSENALSLNHKIKMLKQFQLIIRDLVVSDVAFDRDFDLHYSALLHRKVETEKADYAKWSKELVERATKGKEKFYESMRASREIS